MSFLAVRSSCRLRVCVLFAASAFYQLNRRHVRHCLRLFERRFVVSREGRSPLLRADGSLSAQTESCNYFVVLLNILTFKIVKQTSALRDHFEQAPSRVIVLFVSLEMFGQFRDPLAQ